MTTLAPQSPVRRPFGMLDNSRLQSLTSIKNRQNAIPTKLNTPTKRRHVQDDYSNEDSENVDPSLLASPSKKAKGSSDQPFSKTMNTPKKFYLTAASNTSKSAPVAAPPSSPILTRTIHNRPMLSPRKPSAIVASNNTPTIAPAGRSPKSKRIGILSRARTSSSPFTRISPPSSLPSASAPPFSIDAALSGTLPSYTPQTPTPTPAPAPVTAGAKRGWFFDIYEDSEQERLTTVMQHTTSTLDLSSDDESSIRARDDRGKENVPPMTNTSTHSTTNASISRDGVLATVTVERDDDQTRPRAKRPRVEAAAARSLDVRAPLGDLVEGEYESSPTGIDNAEASAEAPPPAIAVEQACEAIAEKAKALEAEDADNSPLTGKGELPPYSSPLTLPVLLEEPQLAPIEEVELLPAEQVAEATFPAPWDIPLPDTLDALGEKDKLEIWESESAKAEQDADVDAETGMDGFAIEGGMRDTTALVDAPDTVMA